MSIDDYTNRIVEGDAIEVLRGLPDESVHAVVTDPPYGMAFMPGQNEWDVFDSPEAYQSWCERWGREALRILKPGGHCIAYGGDRTHHRLFSGLEDAGLEIRHTLLWLFADNFPKSDALLKPGAEFPVLARKPLDGTLVDNMERHGVGALNVDACRIPLVDGGGDGNWAGASDSHQGAAFDDESSGLAGGVESEPDEGGRYPTNVALDKGAAAMLDAQTGRLESGETDFSRHTDSGSRKRAYGDHPNSDEREDAYYGDAGGASRFYYAAKATEAERTLNGRIENPHPTVKPGELVGYHVELVTWPEQVVLDPFAGSGTTCMVARRLSRRFIGVERDPQWVAVAQARTGLTVENPGLLEEADDGWRPLDAFADGGRHD